MVLSLAAPPLDVWRRPEPPRPSRTAQVTPGHNRWHAELPPVAEVITGGSVRLECEGPQEDGEPLLCGPISVVGAEPGDVIVIDVLGIGRTDGRYSAGAHPGLIGCAPPPAAVPDPGDPDGAVLGHITPTHPAYERIAAEALRSADRGRDIGGCGIAPLTAGSRILLPVHAAGARLSVGDLHFPAGTRCRVARPGWIDLRVNLTRCGVDRFGVTGPLLMPDPA